LRRLLFVSGMNGWSVAVMTFVFTIGSLVFGEWIGVLTSLAAFASGVIELKGRSYLKTNLAQAKQYLICSQIWLFTVIFVYSVYQLISFQLPPDVQSLPPELQEALRQLMPNSIDTFGTLVKQIVQFTYLTVIGVSFLYQGGLALFYKRSVSKLLKVEEREGYLPRRSA